MQGNQQPGGHIFSSLIRSAVVSAGMGFAFVLGLVLYVADHPSSILGFLSTVFLAIVVGLIWEAASPSKPRRRRR